MAFQIPLLILPFTALPILAQSHLAASNFSLSKSTLGPFFGVLDGNFQPARSVAEAGEKTDLVVDVLAVDLLDDEDGSGKGKDKYTLYEGNGTTAAGWPKKKDWVSYGDM